MKQFLDVSKYIDWDQPDVIEKARLLAVGYQTEEQVVRACFEFVRDGIKHSCDFKLNPVTCKASDVLKAGTGYCYAKSHLLAALLRANGIPSALCYQRLTIDNDIPPYSLHGLNAVFLEQYGWYRLDARGNKPGVVADFCPPLEKLAFPILVEGESDLPEIWPEPLPVVVDVLEKAKSYLDVYKNLPDIELLGLSNKN